MDFNVDEYSRVEKLLIDRYGIEPLAARQQLTSCRLELTCGPEIATSPSLQAALLTAANTGRRCKLDVQCHLAVEEDVRLLVPWGSSNLLDEALMELGVAITHAEQSRVRPDYQLVFGTGSTRAGLQVSFDGWYAAVGPVADGFRLAERDYCVLAGVAAGALG